MYSFEKTTAINCTQLLSLSLYFVWQEEAKCAQHRKAQKQTEYALFIWKKPCYNKKKLHNHTGPGGRIK